ncbi:MAG: hypothetical protein ACK4P4_05495 [Allorhizobium sp.]
MPFDQANPLAGGTVGVSAFDAPDPSFLDTLGASFRLENIIGSGLSRAQINSSYGDLSAIDPSYNVYQDEDMRPIVEKHPELFEGVYNRNAAMAARARIGQEEKDRATRAASGWTGLGTDIAASIVDLPTLIPGGALVRSGKVGYSVLRSSAAVGVAAGVGTAVQEAGLQATQELRTAEESAINIGGSVILGGILGGAASKFLSGAEWGRVSKQLEADLADEVPDPGEVTQTIISRMQSAGAAAVDEVDISDLGVGGPKAAELVARATAAARINPGIQTMLSPSVKVREIYGRMVDNPIYTTMQMEGRSLGPDVENLVKQYERGALAQWLQSSSDLYRQAKKDGFRGTKSEFYQAVSRAGRRGDVDPDGNQFISKAAADARSLIFDPLLERAKALKLLPEDVKVSTAASYVTRLWNRQRLIGEEERFREIARSYFSKELDRAVIRQEEIQLGNKVVSSMEVDDRFARAFDRLQNVEGRLAQREKVRSGKLSRVQQEEARRFEVLRERAPKEVVDALRDGAGGDNLIKLVRESRTAEGVKRAKAPVLGVLRKRGGVRIGSPLAAELNAMGVTPKTAPGLFRKDGGRGAADNIVAEEFDFFDDLPIDDAGYVSQDAILDAIRQEVAGMPVRSGADVAEIENAEAMAANAKEWLESIGLSENASIKEIRERLNSVLGAEKQLGETDQRIARLNGEIDEFDKATDALRNEQIISDAEARNVAEELRTLEDEINASADLAKSSPAIARMVDYAKVRRDYGKARYEQVRATNRLDALRLVDADGRLTPDLEAEMIRLTREVADIDARVEKARAKSDKLKPMLPKQKQEIPDFISPEDRGDYIEDIVSSVYNNLTGKGQGDVPEWIVPVTRGPLKERTFNIPDEFVEDFLENDMEMILRRYSRTMAAEVELTDKFGRADMKMQMEEIRNEYEDLRRKATTQKERERLVGAEERDVKNLSAFRDMIRGTYRAAEEGSEWSKITRAALTWNYIRLLGGVTLSSLSDAMRLVGVHGVRATMREALPGLVKGVKAAQISRADARSLGAVTERVLQSRLASLADLQDPYRYGTKFDRYLSNASHAFTKATGLGWWNDTMKMMASVMTQNRMMRTALSYAGADAREKAYLAYLGIDEDMASRIASQFQKHGMQEDGIYGANVGVWDDDRAARAWAAALNKDVDRTIITKGVADTPLWMKTNWGRLIMQFKSFGLASNQRVLIAGLQERPHRLAEQMVMGTSIGMMIGYLKYLERGDEEEANRLMENPGLWIADGLDRTGILSMPFEISNTAEKLGAPIGIMSAAQAIAGDEDQGGSASRYASRNKLGTVMGPSAGLFEDIATIAQQLSEGDLKKSGANAIIRQVPGATLPGMRTAIHVGIKPALQDAVD